MTTRELNPNHPVTTELRHEWHKLLAIAMHKLGLREIIITPADIEALSLLADGINVVAHAHADCIEIKLVGDAEAERLARKHGGLPL